MKPHKLMLVVTSPPSAGRNPPKEDNIGKLTANGGILTLLQGAFLFATIENF